MSFDRSVRYPTKWLPPTASNPLGVPKNSTTETSKDGSPFEKDFIADTEGFFQGLLSRSNIMPSGNPDTALVSDFLDGLDNNIGRIASRSFSDVASMVAMNNIAAGMTLYVRDYYSDKRGGAGFYLVKTESQKNADGDLIDELGNFTSSVSGLFLILQDVMPVTIENFGARFDEDSSIAIRGAIASRKFKPTIIPAKRYIYDGVVITDDVCVLVGRKKPTLKAGATGLENGSIIEGTFSITSSTAWLTDFGVDLGTDTAAPVGDGLKCTAPLDAGGPLHVNNIIALCKNPSDAFHSLLFESYQKVTGGTIEGVNSFFGLVIKCKNVNLNSVYSFGSEKRGVYLKSDTTFGKSWYINIVNIITDGNGEPGQGFYIQSDGAEMDNINITNVLIRGYAMPFEANVTALGPSVNRVNITNMILIEPTQVAFLVNAPSVSLSDFKINNLSIIDCEDRAIWSNGNVDFLQIGMAYISYKAGTLDAVLEDAVKIGVDTKKTTIQAMTITRDGSSNDADQGYINYENSKTDNVLSNRICKVKGVGVPENGVSVESGLSGSFTLSPPDNKVEKSVSITTELTANGTVTAIDNERYPGVLFETGTTLTIMNNSGFSLTVSHNPAPGFNIRNKGSVSVVLGGTDMQSWMLSSTGVWTEV